MIIMPWTSQDTTWMQFVGDFDVLIGESIYLESWCIADTEYIDLTSGRVSGFRSKSTVGTAGFTQTISGQRGLFETSPTVPLLGRSALNFDGSSRGMDYTGTWPTSFTKIVVCQYPTKVATGGIFSTDTAVTNKNTLQILSTNDLRAGIGSAFQIDRRLTRDDTVWYVLIQSWDAATSTQGFAVQGGSFLLNTNVAASVDSGAMRLGANSAGSGGLTGFIREVQVWSTALHTTANASLFAIVNNYLRATYAGGIPLV